MKSSVVADEVKLKGEFSSLREKFAVVYRIEMKMVLLNQLKLLRIAR